MYADFEYYTDVYYGNIISSGDFARYASRASDFIDYFTMGKAAAKADLPEVKKCCCALAEQYLTIQNANVRASAAGGEIQSESVGSHSRSFASGADTVKSTEELMGSIARKYLLPTGLLYRGIR